MPLAQHSPARRIPPDFRPPLTSSKQGDHEIKEDVMRRIAIAVAVGLVGVTALPAAAAKPTNHASGPNSNHCTYKAAYRVHGTYVMSDLTKDLTTGTYSGTTVELIETSANHHAKAATVSGFTASTGADMTFPISGANVTVADEVDTSGGPTAGPPADRVMVKGTITELHKGCTTNGFTQAVTIKRVVVTPPETS
jgi:hypothetical protein